MSKDASYHGDVNPTLASPTLRVLDAVRTAPSLLSAIELLDQLADAVRRDGDRATSELADAIAEGRPASSVTELIDPATARFEIGTDRPLEALLREPALQELGALIAIDREGLMAGVVTIDQVRRALLNPSASV